MTERFAQDHVQGAADAFRAAIAVIALFRRNADPATDWPDGFEFTLKTLDQCMEVASYHLEQALTERPIQ
ncbi:MAG: hypothetical protein EPN34_07015 [Burkholderiaceae bacterium]|nr:MAG: hypothetical protein EPN34_07015 [Burkholderiaceae bacterium]